MQPKAFRLRGLRAALPVRLAALMAASTMAAAAPQTVPRVAPNADFQAFIAALEPLAREKGVRAATFAAAFAGLTLDASLGPAATKQPEFDRPLPDYLAGAVSDKRIRQGQAELAQHASALRQIAQSTGVAPEMIVSLWGMESDFNRARGSKDVIRSLASLAFLRPERPLFRDELLSALVILETAKIPREKLCGSWAGAMGGPQFLPSAYLKYAAAFHGRKPADIWTNPADILASIANFLALSGWVAGESWGYEVILPENFGFQTLHQSFAGFAGQGVRRADGGVLPENGEAALFLPAGAPGPAFLLTANYWVLKAYNNSDSYALSAGLLADRMTGAKPLHKPWPKGQPQLSRGEKIDLQARLKQLALYAGPLDGRFGQTSRDSIHALQLKLQKSPADGYATRELLAELAKITASPLK